MMAPMVAPVMPIKMEATVPDTITLVMLRIERSKLLATTVEAQPAELGSTSLPTKHGLLSLQYSWTTERTVRKNLHDHGARDNAHLTLPQPPPKCKILLKASGKPVLVSASLPGVDILEVMVRMVRVHRCFETRVQNMVFGKA